MFAAPVAAQGPIEGEGSKRYGNATVTVGGGTAILILPDVPSLMTFNVESVGTFINGFKASDDFGDEIGWNVNGSIEVPMGANRTVSLNGFWANIEDEDSLRCNDGGTTTTCGFFPLVNDPSIQQSVFTFAGVPSQSLITNATREVDHWGVSLEVKQQLNPGVSGVTRAPHRRTLAIGADVRGIDQDLEEVFRFLNAPAGAGPATYTEDLDTRYYGVYAAWGGDINPFLFKGLWGRWGLHSTFQLRGGVYYADTDYEGRLVDSTTSQGVANATSALSLSDDDVTFIGGLVMETKKRLGQRATLSLKSEYEYYSYVPEMAYNQFDIGAFTAGQGGQRGTRIGDDDAFSARTSLRLTIKLGPDSVFEEPLK